MLYQYNRLGISKYSTQLPSGPWAICSYGAAAHCTTVVCLETGLHYDIYGLKVNRLLTNMDGLRPPAPPPLYYASAQKSPLFFSGAVVEDSPHGPAGSCTYRT
jgi:hypothetical protein